MTILAGVDIPFTNNKQLANQAIEKAGQALTSADGKSKNYYQAETPTDPKENDLWFKTTASGIVTNFYQYIDGGWKENFTTLSALSADLGTVVAGTLRAVLIEGSEIIGSIIRSADEGTEFYVEGGNMILSRTNGRKVTINPDGLYGLNSLGEILFKADRGLVTSAALGTSNSNVYLAANSINEARVVDIKSIPSDGAAENYTYRPIRVLGLKFGPGANGYIGTDGELRITSSGFTQDDGSVIYRDLRAGAIYGTAFIAQTDNAYIGTNDELRVVNKGLSGIYRNVRANGYFGAFLTADPDLYAYIGTDLGLRVTSRGLASAGPVYRDVTAASFSNGSRIESKSDIVLWEEDALSVICESDLASYFLNGDIEQGREIRKYGLVIGGEWRTPQQVINGDGIDQYVMTTFAWRGLQQVDGTLKTHDTEIKRLSETVVIQAAEIQKLSETVATQQQQLTNSAKLIESLTNRFYELEERVALLEAK